MNDIILPLIIGVVAIIVGYGIAKILEKNKASNIIKSAKKRATAIAKQAGKDAESLKKDKMLQAKEKFLELKAEHERVILNRDKKISEAEKRTEKASELSFNISQKIQTEMTYPGQVKVTVIRETRAVNIAK